MKKMFIEFEIQRSLGYKDHFTMTYIFKDNDKIVKIYMVTFKVACRVQI